MEHSYQVSIDYPHGMERTRAGSCYTLRGTFDRVMQIVSDMLRVRRAGAIAHVYRLEVQPDGPPILLQYARLERAEDGVVPRYDLEEERASA